MVMTYRGGKLLGCVSGAEAALVVCSIFQRQISQYLFCPTGPSCYVALLLTYLPHGVLDL